MDVDKIAQLITVAVSMVAIIVTLITANTSAKSSALNDLKSVVQALKTEVEDQKITIKQLRRDLARERRLRMAYEDYIQACIMKFREIKVEPPLIEQFISKDEAEEIEETKEG